MATDEDREALIDLIKWYRDEYHHCDFGHADMMEQARTAADLEPLWKTVDMWLDQQAMQDDEERE